MVLYTHCYVTIHRPLPCSPQQSGRPAWPCCPSQSSGIALDQKNKISLLEVEGAQQKSNTDMHMKKKNNCRGRTAPRKCVVHKCGDLFNQPLPSIPSFLPIIIRPHQNRYRRYCFFFSQLFRGKFAKGVKQKYCHDCQTIFVMILAQQIAN